MMDDDDEYDALNDAHSTTTPRASGIRFYWWADAESEDAESEDAESEDAVKSSFPDRTMSRAANELATAIGEQVGGTASWRSLPTGGAGENGAVELVAIAVNALTLLHILLKTPGEAMAAWKKVSAFLKLAEASPVDWEASSDLATLHCLSVIQAEWEGAYTNPFAVKVVEDGSFAAMFADRPTGVHVIVIPDLCHKKTHVFAIDSRLVIHGRFMIDRLTADAETAEPPR